MILCLSVQSCSDWADKDVEETQKRGHEVIAALEAYRKENETYPALLAVLVPDYVPLIRSPTVGRCSWKYTTYHEGREFILKAEGSSEEEPSMWYNSRFRRWSLDTK